MNNKQSSTWGVVPGRQVGTVTRRFHKRRDGTDAERAVAKALGVSLSEARRQLRYAQEYQKGRTPESKLSDCIELTCQRLARLDREAAKAEREEAARLVRVAQHTER